jgi:adenylate cyclase
VRRLREPEGRLWGGGRTLSGDQHERAGGWLAWLGKRFVLGGRDGQEDRSVEELILGGPRRYTRRELLAESGLEPQLVTRLWNSMGFTDTDGDEVAFTDIDRQALRRLDEARACGLMPTDIQIAATRTLGQAMGGLAEWQVGALQQMLRDTRGDVDEDHTQDTAQRLLTLTEWMQNYVWRRHLAAAAGRLVIATPDGSNTRTLVVGFADMVDFTRTTRRLSSLAFVELVERFHAIAGELVSSMGGRVIKTVGDEVLFSSELPAAAAEIALGLIEAQAAIESLPQLRIGMALGAVLSRFGDVYGESVNIASRLTTHAKPGRICIDRNLAEALKHHDKYRVSPRRRRNVRGYRHLPSWGLARVARA